MKPACRSFRSLLEEKLVGLPDAARLTSLSWHEHLLGCVACRDLFESEETLEALLATLPEPNLTPEIKRRVLVALARSKTADRALDHLLDRGSDVEVPAGFAQDVLARLAPLRSAELKQSDAVDAASESRLDALLERAATLEIPAGLARRTLEALQRERSTHAPQLSSFAAQKPHSFEAESKRAATATSPIEEGRLDALLARAGDVAVPEDLTAHTLSRLAPARRALARSRLKIVRSTWVYAAAAVLVAALLVWAMWPKHTGPSVPPLASQSSTDPSQRVGTSVDGSKDDGQRTARNLPQADDHVARAPDPKMLEAFDVLENWELLTRNDVDVILSTVQPADELLLEFQDEG
jgi:hypothetical protein